MMTRTTTMPTMMPTIREDTRFPPFAGSGEVGSTHTGPVTKRCQEAAGHRYGIMVWTSPLKKPDSTDQVAIEPGVLLACRSHDAVALEVLSKVSRLNRCTGMCTG